MRINNIFRGIIIITVFIFVTGNAAKVNAQNVKGSFNFIMGFPQGEFGNNVKNTGMGLSGTFGYNFNQSPVMLGFEAGFLIYGRDRRKEPFSTTIPDVTVNVIDTNWIINGNLLLRIQPYTGKFQPYFDGLIGISYLLTETSVTSERNRMEPIATSTDLSDYAFNYGAGGGMRIKVWEIPEGYMRKKHGLNGVFIDVRLRYLFGSEAEYLKEGSIRRENGNITYHLNESRTDLLLAHIGISLAF